MSLLRWAQTFAATRAHPRKRRAPTLHGWEAWCALVEAAEREAVRGPMSLEARAYLESLKAAVECSRPPPRSR